MICRELSFLADTDLVDSDEAGKEGGDGLEVFTTRNLYAAIETIADISRSMIRGGISRVLRAVEGGFAGSQGHESRTPSLVTGGIKASGAGLNKGNCHAYAPLC